MNRRIVLSIVAAIAGLVWAAPGAGAVALSDWGAPVNVESIPGTSSSFNTPDTDGCPIQSPDGRSFYMATNRPGGLGGLDIWVAHRPNTHSPWGAPENLGAPVNSEADDFCPTPVIGGRLFFVSARAGGCGLGDIYVTKRSGGAWAAPSNLGCGVNSAGGEAGPSLVVTLGDRALYFSSNRAGGVTPESTATGDMDIYRAPLRGDGSFGAAALVPELSSSFEDARPNVRLDGREVVLDSNRTGTLGGPDIYAATRPSTFAAWGVPGNLGVVVNTPSSETRASFSLNGLTLYFGSNRPGSELSATGTPSNDIYVTTRRALCNH